MRKALLSGVAGISLAVGVGPAFADPPLPNLTNLNFSSYSGSNPKNYFTNVDPTGWTGGSGLIFIAQNTPGHDATVGPGGTYYAPSGGTIVPAGGNYVEADGNPIYESGFNYKVTGLTVGTTYTLTFYQGASQWDGFSGDTTNQWVAALTTVASNGLYVASNSDPLIPTNYCGTNCGYFSTDPNASIKASPLMNVPSQGVVNWNFVSLNLTADATTDLLSFLAWGDNGNTENLPPIAFLAGVNSAAGLGASTPEPSTWVMMGIGFAGLGVVVQRRRRRDKRLQPSPQAA
jgi:hypothetical protein